ncbi:CCD81 protein, partial [Zosterops hypoxanthus]|nr:CCD81 protein [Zosterops hypoxanthus]
EEMQKFLLYNSVEPEELPTLRELNTIEICKIWSAISRHIYKQLLQKRAVEIGIGSFAVVPTHATVAEGKVLPIERPMFILNKPVKMFYSLESEEAKIPEETPIVNPDFEAITANTHFRHEIVDHCVQETLLCFAGALRDNKEVEFSFR